MTRRRSGPRRRWTSLAFERRACAAADAQRPHVMRRGGWRMAGVPITQFEPDPVKRELLRACMENYDVGDAGAEWPNNIISRRAVVYGSGVIARSGDLVRHAVDPDELGLCRRLAREAEAVMAGIEIGRAHV